MSSWELERDFAARIAREAGGLVLEHFRRGVRTEWKADASPVTVADREAEVLLRQRIGERFPADGVLGEEGGEHLGTSGRRWVLDPIDGTKCFICGVPLFAVLVALEVAGAPVVGACFLPGLDEMVAASQGGGCFWNGASCHVSPTARLEEATVIYTELRTFDASGPAAVRARQALASRARLMRGWGDAYGYALVATGRADVMVDPALYPWDCAPLIPILAEAGGRFTDWSGRETHHGGNGFATNGILHGEVLELLR
ncbi:MAG: histidinol-phosphatase [Candidatus Schekmanbacteria bacterium]|nr:histidinol-phosphatase [Candidatus Schekmanbacteria bacterium]